MSEKVSSGAFLPTKVLFLVLSKKNEPWNTIEAEGQRATFAADDFKDINFLWLRGVSSTEAIIRLLPLAAIFAAWWQIFVFQLDKYGFRGTDRFPGMRRISRSITRIARDIQRRRAPMEVNRYLEINVPDFRALIGLKTLLAFDHVLKTHDFDFIIRTNSSSYFDLDRLRKFLRTAPTERYFAGFDSDFYGEEFRSGAAYILSRDVVEGVAANADSWNHELPDDVAISRLVRETNLANPTPLRRQILESPEDAERFVSSAIRPGEQIPFHFRCKTGDAPGTISIMRALARAGF